MLYFVIAGLMLALLLKRNPLSILNVTYRMPYLMIGGFALQIVLALVAAKYEIKLSFFLMLSMGIVLVGLYLNRHLHGIGWIFAGALMNLLAIVLHGGFMPVSEKAIERAGLSVDKLSIAFKHQLMEPTMFWWLGDWIPVYTLFGPNVVLSLGDFVIGAGIVLFIAMNASRISKKRMV